MTLSIRHGAAALRCGARPAARGGPDQRRCRRDHRPGVPALPRRGSGVLPGVRPGRGWLGPLARARGLPAEHARGLTVHETNVLAARLLEGNGARTALLFGANMRRRIWYQVGAALDWPVGRRFFVRVDARLIVYRVGIGAGIGF